MTEKIEIDDLETGETEVLALEELEPAPASEAQQDPTPAAQDTPPADQAQDEQMVGAVKVGKTIAPVQVKEGDQAQSIGKLDPATAMKGTVSITITFMPEPEEPGQRRMVVAAIRHEMGLPLAIRGPFPEAELDLPALFDELRQAMADVLLHESAQGKRPARSITFQKPNAATPKPAPQKGKFEEVKGQLGLF